MIIVMLVYPIGTRTQCFAAVGTQTPVPLPTQTPERVARAIMQSSECDKHRMYPSALFRLIPLLDRLLTFTRRIEQRLEQHKIR